MAQAINMASLGFGYDIITDEFLYRIGDETVRITRERMEEIRETPGFSWNVRALMQQELERQRTDTA